VVRWQTVPLASGSVDVAFEITPGPIYTVGAIELRGNAHVARGELEKALIGTIAPGMRWSENLVLEAAHALKLYYEDHGFPLVEIGGPPPSAPHAPQIFEIHEGDEYRLGKIEFTGVSPQTANLYGLLFGVKPGERWSRSAVDAGLQRIQMRVNGNAVLRGTREDKKRLLHLTIEVTTNR